MAIKYKWLAARLKDTIQKNIENETNKLPTEEQLCSRYRVSRQTVRAALSILENEGIIVKKHGSGSYITGISSDHHKNVVGILISNQQEYIYPRVLYDIQKTLEEGGYSCVIYETHNNVSEERNILLQLLKNPLRAIIVEGCKSALPNPNIDLYQKLIDGGMEMLFIFNYYSALMPCLYLKDDNLYGSNVLVEHLLDLGHYDIAGIFKTDDLQGVERYQGYIESLRNFNLPIKDERIGWYNSQDLYRLEMNHDTSFIKNFVENTLKSCTAVISYNDELSYYLVKELILSGYTLPDDMTVVSFDNTYMSESDILSVTTLSHTQHEMGARAANLIMDKLKGLPVISQEIPWTLNIKESSAKKSNT